MRLRGRRYDTEELVEVTCESGQVIAVGPPTNQPVDHEAEWIAPGFFDLQVNGAGGISFNLGTLTVDEVSRAVRMISSHGVTGMLPTLVTNSLEALVHALETLKRTLNEDAFVRARVPGFHLEGPWISPEDGYRGAHPKEHVRLPSWDDFQRLQDAAGGHVRMITLAPELPHALRFIAQLARRDVLVSVGHSMADFRQLQDAHLAGVTMITHVGNGVPALLPRHANPIWDQLACPIRAASIIADGFHLTDSVLKCICQIRRTRELVLISDASSFAGMNAGRYRDWGQDVEVVGDGRVLLSNTPYLAGSGVFLDQCVAYFTNVDCRTAAIQMACENPRTLLKRPQPTISIGSASEFVLFDQPQYGKLTVRSVVC